MVHVMFVFKDPSKTDAAFDRAVNLSFQLPVKDEA